jgi:hypothetical protein
VRLHVLAIGERLVEWQQTACDDYARRFVRPWSIEVTPVRAEPRVEAKPVAKMAAAEAQRQAEAQGSRSQLLPLRHPVSPQRLPLPNRGIKLTMRRLSGRHCCKFGTKNCPRQSARHVTSTSL